MQTIHKLMTVLALAFFAFTVHAQTPGNAKIAGNIYFGLRPVEAASVALAKAKDSVVVKMATTDKDGHFEFEKVAAGKYLLITQSVGFAKQYGEVFDITPATTVYTSKPVVLQQASKELQAVTVSTKKPFIEQKLDRTIINVDASPSNAGTTILEMLEKSPGISVDKDGNISLKGKQGVMVMMDGKPTYLGAQDLANMLRSMPSSNLEQIEIMTNPPAKYDASGNSGVINIKTKKTKVMGYNASIATGYGQGAYSKTTNSFNLNYREGKFNFFGNASHNYSKNFGKMAIVRNFRDQGTGVLLSNFDQLADNTREFNSYSYKAGFDYFASKKTTLGVVVNGFGNEGTEFTNNTTYIRDNTGSLTTRTLATNEVKLDMKNIGANFNLRHVFDSTGKELTIDLDYINYNSANNQYLNNRFFDNQNNKKSADELLRGILPSDINIYAAKMDYTQPMKRKMRFEAGLKSSYVETDNDAQYANWNGNQYVIDAARSNHFLYKENINAAYATLNKEFSKKWSGQLGVRMENTNVKGRQLTTGQSFDRNYTQLFPTVYIGYNASDKNQFALSYGRRIDRPNYQDLNPFIHFLDKYTYEVGNPYLNPQFSHNFELSHTYGGILTTSINYSNTKDIIQDVLEQVDSTNSSFVKKSNIAKRQNLGLSISLGMPLTKWWRTNAYVNVFYNKFSGIVNNGYIEVDGTAYMVNVSNLFSFKKGWGAELSGAYRSRSIEGVLVSRPMGAMHVAFSKQVLKNKGTFKLGLRDVLYTQVFSGYSKYQNVDLTLRQSRDSRVVTLNFSYRFGKGKTVAQRKRGGAGDEQNRVSGGSSN